MHNKGVWMRKGECAMNACKKMFSGVLSLLAVGVVLFYSPGESFSALSANIPRMIQECPSFSDYPGSSGVIWLKDVRYSLGADGAMTRDSVFVILARRGIDESWSRWTLPVPEDGGSVEVFSAALYDPGSGRMLSPVLPRKSQSGGVSVVELAFPDLQEEYIISLSYREVFPKRFAVDDFIWVNETLPLWELQVTVDVPAGSDLAVSARGVGDLRRENAGAVERHAWHMVNNLPWTTRTLRGDARSYLAFSTRKGLEPLARMLSAYENVLVPQPSAPVEKLINQQNKLRTGSALISWMNAAPSFQGPFLSSIVRSTIPEEGPWSEWEKVLILNRWMRKAGWESTVHWLTAHALNDGTPASGGSVLRPVLELNLVGISPFFLDLGQSQSPNETPPSLWGKHIYTSAGSSLTGRIVSGSSAAEHRLSVEWSLELSADGEANGRVDVFVRNGWNAFFFPGGSPNAATLKRLVNELLPNLPFTEGTEAVKSIKYGWQVTFPVSLRNSIVSGGSMLFPYPAVLPSWLNELGRWSEEYRMNFPFVIEQNFTLKLPPKTDIVMLPASATRSLEKVKYEESVFHNRRRNTLTAGAKLVLSTDTINDAAGRSLAEAVQRWMSWGTKNLPMRSR